MKINTKWASRGKKAYIIFCEVWLLEWIEKWKYNLSMIGIMRDIEGPAD